MYNTIQTLKATRKYLLNGIAELSTEQLNKIPEGFNNNIIWNLAHMISAQQGLCYVRAGAPVAVEEKYFSNYKPGTKPEGFVDAAEVAIIKELLFSTLDQLEKDIQTTIFSNYPLVVTRYAVELKSVEDAIAFLPFHEGLHSGVIASLAKIVK